MKEALRTAALAARNAMPATQRAQADAAILARLRQHPALVQADRIFTYLSIGSEVDTHSIIKAAQEAGKIVAIPRCIPGTRLMEWHRFTNADALIQGSYGIAEPAANAATLVLPPRNPSTDIALVPGCAFDSEGFRLGYGGGYYDTFLATFGGISIGLCRRTDYSETSLPRQLHDRPVDLVILDH